MLARKDRLSIRNFSVNTHSSNWCRNIRAIPALPKVWRNVYARFLSGVGVAVHQDIRAKLCFWVEISIIVANNTITSCTLARIIPSGQEETDASLLRRETNGRND